MSTDTLHSTTGPSGPSPEDNPADAEAIVREIERPNQYEPEEFDRPDLPNAPDEIDRSIIDGHHMPTMDLPGYGEELDTCGEDWLIFCKHCGDPTHVGQTCRKSTCPRCAQDWNRRAATALSSKLKALWAYKMGSSSAHQFFHHLTISMPDDWALAGNPDTVYSRTKDVVKAVMDELGIHGVPIYHPFRGSEEEPGDDLGIWKERQYQQRSWEDVRGELEFSPHWHIIGVAPYVDISVTEEVESRTGWVIHRIQDDDTGVSVGNDWDLARVVSYCLSHCGVYQGDSGDYQTAYYPNVIDKARPGTDGITANDEITERMDKIVRSVVPKTLGIDYHSVACGSEVPKDAAADSVSLATAVGKEEGSGDGDGDGDGDDESTETTDSPDRVKCGGAMLGADKIPEYLDNDDWRREAPKAGRLEHEHREWRRRRGIPG